MMNYGQFGNTLLMYFSCCNVGFIPFYRHFLLLVVSLHSLYNFYQIRMSLKNKKTLFYTEPTKSFGVYFILIYIY